NETAEEVSKKIGEKTIESSSRSGSPTSLSKSQTEGTEGRRLLTADELRRLKEGEMVVIRGIKRQDLQRGRIKPYPIYNTKKTAIKYRLLSFWCYKRSEEHTSELKSRFDFV